MTRVTRNLLFALFLGMPALADPPVAPIVVPGGEEAIGQVVKVTRPTSVYGMPSGKAKVLADVDPGAVLVLKRISPKGTWLYLEDEDGNAGWLPRNRTDFFLVRHQDSAAKDKNKVDKKQSDGPFDQDIDEHKRAKKSEPTGSMRHELAFYSRKTFERFNADPNGTFAMGAAYSFMAPGPRFNPEVERESWAGFQLGVAAAYLNGHYSGITAPLRYRMVSHDGSSPFGFGPDLGLLYFYRKQQNDSEWSLSFGYSVGWVPHSSGLFALMRLGAEFIHSPRLSLELSLGTRL